MKTICHSDCCEKGNEKKKYNNEEKKQYFCQPQQ